MKIAVPAKDGHMKIIRTGTEEYEPYREAIEKFEWECTAREIEEWERADRRRVLKSYPPDVASHIFLVERSFGNYIGTGDFTELFNLLKKRVNYWVEIYVRDWSRWRLSYPDFESVLWEEAWRIVVNYNGLTDFYLAETIERSFKPRCIDVIRKATKTKQGRFEHGVLPLFIPENKESPDNVEKEVTDRVLIEEMINDPSLTNEDKRFLKTLYESPGAHFQELADLMGYAHRETARRKLMLVGRKLRAYRDIALAG